MNICVKKYFSSLYQPPYCHCCHWWQSWWLELAELVLPLPLPSLLALALIWNTPDISHNISRPNIIFSPQFPQQFRQMMNIASLTGLTLLGWTDWDWTLCVECSWRARREEEGESCEELETSYAGTPDILLIADWLIVLLINRNTEIWWVSIQN